MTEINIPIHDIVVEYDGITLVEQNGGKTKILMNEQEQELLKERLQEQ